MSITVRALRRVGLRGGLARDFRAGEDRYRGGVIFWGFYLMGTRITQRGLAQAVLVAKQANPAVVITFTANAIEGNKALKFHGEANVGGTVYDFASTNGKLKLFGQADDLVKFIAGAVPAGTGDYPLTIKTGDTLAASVPADLVKAAADKVVKLNATKVAQQAVITEIDAQLALMTGWETGSSLQIAKLNETNTQKAAVQADIAAIDAEIVRLS